MTQAEFAEWERLADIGQLLRVQKALRDTKARAIVLWRNSYGWYETDEFDTLNDAKNFGAIVDGIALDGLTGHRVG